jgi:hypothetical protein
MSDLTEFILARIADDEAVARAATPGPWAWQPPSKDSWPQGDESLVAPGDEWQPDSYFGGCTEFLREFHGTRELEDGSHLHRTTRTVVSGWGYDASGTDADDEDRAHIARHDPTRVLAQCAAYRLIVAEHTGYGEDHSDTSHPCDTLRALASIWSSHPDYPLED